MDTVIGWSNDYNSPQLLRNVKSWLQEILLIENSNGDYDKDQTINSDDADPFIYFKEVKK